MRSTTCKASTPPPTHHERAGHYRPQQSTTARRNIPFLPCIHMQSTHCNQRVCEEDVGRACTGTSTHLLLLQLRFGGGVGSQEGVRVYVVPQQHTRPVHLHWPRHARLEGGRGRGGHHAQQRQVVWDLRGRLQLERFIRDTHRHKCNFVHTHEGATTRAIAKKTPLTPSTPAAAQQPCPSVSGRERKRTVVHRQATSGHG